MASEAQDAAAAGSGPATGAQVPMPSAPPAGMPDGDPPATNGDGKLPTETTYHQGPNVTLKELLASTAIAIVVNEPYLSDWLGDEVETVAKRQDLPEGTLLTGSAAEGLDQNNMVMPISYGWLAREHPDALGARKNDFDEILDRCDMIFWDWMSLFQEDRNDEQRILFKKALKDMHLVYSNPHWRVARVLTVPEGADNTTPYEARGWCHFESAVASLPQSCFVFTFLDGRETQQATMVPVTPEQFGREITKKKFSAAAADSVLVKNLYEKVFKQLCYGETLNAWFWGDEELDKLQKMLPMLPGLKKLSVTGCLASEDGKTRLEDALKERGGEAKFH